MKVGLTGDCSSSWTCAAVFDSKSTGGFIVKSLGRQRVSGFVEQQLRAEEWLCAIGSLEASNQMLYE